MEKPPLGGIYASLFWEKSFTSLLFLKLAQTVTDSLLPFSSEFLY